MPAPQRGRGCVISVWYVQVTDREMKYEPLPHVKTFMYSIMCCAAVSNIGVDVEVCQPRPRTASIAPRVLTEKERCVWLFRVSRWCGILGWIHHGLTLTRMPTKRSSRCELGALQEAGVSIESELLLRFSLKESVYKAIHPFVRRYVSFHEVYPHRHCVLQPCPSIGLSFLSNPTHPTIVARNDNIRPR